MRLRNPARTAPARTALVGAVALMSATALVAVRPAAAQTVYDDVPTVGEVVVYGGPIGPDGRPERLSQAVSYADLDLSTWAGRDALRHRIRDTARSLCDALGESRASDPIGPSCVDNAVRSASTQMRVAVNEAYGEAYARDAAAIVADPDYPR
ncbi:MAG TPA: UrcA family protein [Phenylobacterium sp.]|nr:UrcA family protein [Phenylobacterium sp.]